jgi:hypothetical protein
MGSRAKGGMVRFAASNCPQKMPAKPTVIYTGRDRQIHEALRLTPLDAQQLLKLSETFERPFTSDRKVRERMQEHQAAGWTTTRYYATTGAGQLNYYQLSQDGFCLLEGPRAALPPRSFFRDVSPALQRHTRHVADVLVQTHVHAHRLGLPIIEHLGENQESLSLANRSLKPDGSLLVATQDGVFRFYDEIDEATEPIASNRQRESLEAKIRFHEDYQNATGERYRVRLFFAKAGPRMHQFLRLAAQHASRQRTIFYAVLLDQYLTHDAPLSSPIFLDHFGRLKALVTTPSPNYQIVLPNFAEMLAEPAGVC